MQSPIQDYLASLHRQFAQLRQGEPASYIPELAKVNPEGFGICLVTLDGVAYSVGDADQPFTLQSISKPFVYGTALADRGWNLWPGKSGWNPAAKRSTRSAWIPKPVPRSIR